MNYIPSSFPPGTVTLVPVVFYENAADLNGKQYQLTLDELGEMFVTRTVREKKDGKLFSFVYGDGSQFHRRKSAIVGISGLVLDFNNDIGANGRKLTQIEDIERVLDGYSYGVYSTYGHCHEHPKFRVVVPLSRPLEFMQFDSVYSGLLQLFENDPNVNCVCVEMRGRHYLPSSPQQLQHEAFQRWNAGTLMDPQILTQNRRGTHPAARSLSFFPGAQKQHLENLALALIECGKSREAVTYALVIEDDKFDAPVFTNQHGLDEPDVWTEASKMEERVRRNINRIRIAQNEEPLPGAWDENAPQLKEVNIHGFQQMEIPIPAFAIEKLVPCGQVTLFGAHGGTGKSVLSLTLAAHFAAAQSWAGLAISGGQVLFVSLEDPPDMVLSRLKRIVDEYQLDAETVASRLKIVDGSAVDGSLVTETADGSRRKLVPTPLMKQMEKYSERADLIVIDNASDAFDADENNRRMVHAFIHRLAQLTRPKNAALILLAHIDKQAARSGSNHNSYSGTTDWHNSSRSRLTLKQVGDTLSLEQEKSNLGRKAEPIVLSWTDHGILVPFVENGQEDQAALLADSRALLLAIGAAIADGQNVPSGTPGSIAAQRMLAYYDELPQHLRKKNGRNRFWRALNHLRVTGQVELEEYRNSQRHRVSRYVLVGARAIPPPPPAQ